jgi:hypothetical protein
MSTIDVGKLIKERLEAEERGETWLADKLGKNRSFVYGLQRKNSIDTEMLLKVSKILKFNFFKAYYEWVEEELSGK